MPDGIEFAEITSGQLDVIRFLWEELRDHHAALDWAFAHEMDGMKFEARRQGWLEIEAGGLLRMETASVRDGNRLIGYCISKIDETAVGEIDSMYVTPDFRRRGVAGEFVRRSLAWFTESCVWRKRVVVAADNPEAKALYEKFGFLSRTITMQQLDK